MILGVVYFNQLLGAACTQKLVEPLFSRFQPSLFILNLFVVLPAFGSAQHPKAGQNTQHLGVWSGFIGGQCAVRASASGMYECAVVAVHVSLPSRLRSVAVDLLEKNKNKKEERGQNDFWNGSHAFSSMIQ